MIKDQVKQRQEVAPSAGRYRETNEMANGDSGERERKLALFKKAQDMVQGLHLMLSEKLTERADRNIKQFTDVAEYGLAFEEIVLALLEEQERITGGEYHAICEAYIYFAGALIEVDQKTITKLRRQVC